MLWFSHIHFHRQIFIYAMGQYLINCKGELLTYLLKFEMHAKEGITVPQKILGNVVCISKSEKNTLFVIAQSGNWTGNRRGVFFKYSYFKCFFSYRYASFEKYMLNAFQSDITKDVHIFRGMNLENSVFTEQICVGAS